MNADYIEVNVSPTVFFMYFTLIIFNSEYKLKWYFS